MNSHNKSELLIKEDYWAIWIGSGLLIFGFLIFYVSPKNQIKNQINSYQEIISNHEKIPIVTIESYQAQEKISRLNSGKSEIGELLKRILMPPQKWYSNPLESFYIGQNKAQTLTEKNELALKESLLKLDQLKIIAYQNQTASENKNFEDAALNSTAEKSIAEWHQAQKEYDSNAKKAKVEPFNLFETLLVLAIIIGIIFSIGAHFIGIGSRKFIIGFSAVFLLAIIAHFIGNQASMKNMGFGYAIWAITLGLLLANTIGTPKWIKPALQTEFYIKTGLVLLGAEILFGKILAIGLPGIFVAWVVTPIVLVTTYWFGQRVLKITSKSLNITISADMSVCGVSAAIATAAACNAKKEELTLAVGMSMVFTSIMMIALPAFIKWVGMPEVLGGAWIGGTIDATGAVVAAGAFLGDSALNVAATIKMIQNMLIGVIAFFVAVYWASKVDKKENINISKGEIWKRFPKFILGFVGASIVFSIIYSFAGQELGRATIEQGMIRGFTKGIREWLFCLAFVSIGLSVNFNELKKYLKGGKPLILYLSGQAFNLLLTLLMAYIMFYLVFPEITEKIQQ